MNMVKPPDCTCDYPRRVARNGVGHTPPCPVWQRHPLGGARKLQRQELPSGGIVAPILRRETIPTDEGV